MIKVHSSGIAMKVKVFSGDPLKVEETIAAFLAEKHIKIHGFTQSQSSDSSGGTNVTSTLLYSEYSGEKKEVVGFSRP